MYLHPQHQFSQHSDLQALVRAHPLAAWVCHTATGLVANHVPFVLDTSRGPHGTLLGHVARANPVWRALGPPVPSVLMFCGPHSYISPGWYPGKASHGRVVPTWNYAVAHAHGTARVVHDRAWLLDMLERLSAAQESSQPSPWKPGDAPEQYLEQMLHAIVGIEIPVDRLEGRLKASQDEDLPDRHGTVAGLLQLGTDAACAMATLVQKTLGPELE